MPHVLRLPQPRTQLHERSRRHRRGVLGADAPASRNWKQVCVLGVFVCVSEFVNFVYLLHAASVAACLFYMCPSRASIF